MEFIHMMTTNSLLLLFGEADPGLVVVDELREPDISKLFVS